MNVQHFPIDSNEYEEYAEKSLLQSKISDVGFRVAPMSESRRLDVVTHIENIVLDFLRCLKDGVPPKLRYFNRKIWGNASMESKIMKGSGSNDVTLDFAHSSSRPHIALIFYLLSVVHHQSIIGSSTTKRELYYKCLGTLKCLGYQNSQVIVNNAMSDVGALIGSPPRLLGIIPSSRGLVAGTFCLSLAKMTNVDDPAVILDSKSYSNDCCPIPGDIASLLCGDAVIESPAQVVLIIEKEAAFQRLLENGILNVIKPCLIITGRGYPDVSTRRLVHIIWKCLDVPIFALVDADPHGIEIMCVYRFGSLAMCKDVDDLAVPAIRWLGVHPTDIPILGLSADSILPLGREGLAKAEALLSRPYIQASPLIYEEVVSMIKYKCKAEIEALYSLSPTFVTDVYIPGQIASKKGI